MSFGWSPSDLLSLSQLAFDIYTFCHNAPDELKSVFRKFEIVSQKLERFSSILERSGLGVWEKVPKLREHLLEAKEYLEQFRPVADRTASTQIQAKKTILLAVDKAKVKRIKDHLTIHEQEIDSFRSDLLLLCALRNEQQLDPWLIQQTPLPPQPQQNRMREIGEGSSRLLLLPAFDDRHVADNMSIASTTVVRQVTRALQMAQKLKPELRPLPMIIDSPPMTAESSPNDRKTIKDFRSEIVSLVEEKELYTKDAKPLDNLEELVMISQKAAKLQAALQPSKAGMSAEAVRYHLAPVGELTPQSLGRSIFGDLSLRTDDPSTRHWATNQSLDSHPPSPRLRPNAPLTPAASTSDRTRSSRSRSGPVNSVDHVNEGVFEFDNASLVGSFGEDVGPAAKEHLELQGRAQINLGGESQRSITCQLDVEITDNSIRLWAVATNQRRPVLSTSSSSTPLGVTPSILMGGVQSTYQADVSSQPRTFQHCFQISARPIPHKIHPDVEGPMEEPNAPYKIAFNDRQCIIEEGASEGPRWSTSFVYIFQKKQDRDYVSERIYGKKLVATAGTDKILYNSEKYCHLAALSLWKDEDSGSMTITFFRDFTFSNSKKKPPKDLEYEVLGLEDAKKAARSDNTITIVVAPNPADQEFSPTSASSPISRRSSELTATTATTQSSNKSQKRKKSSLARVTVEFSSPKYKAQFMQHLRQYPNS